MENFYSLQKLLSKLPFSIQGYFEHEKELDNFFIQLCSSDFISQRNNIELVSYSYAKLTNLNSWETDSYSTGFFFHSLNEKYSLLALNIYYTLRNELFQRTKTDYDNHKHLSNNVAIVLSRLFLKDVGFRLCYTMEDNWHFSFYEQNNLFSIKLPLSRIIKITSKEKSSEQEKFRTALSKFLADAIAAIDTEEKVKKLIIQKKEKSNSTYFKFDSDDTPIKTAFNEFRKVFKTKKDLDILKNEFVEAIYFWHRANPGYLTTTDTRKHIENWVELFFQIVFISLVYDAWVEYFPSICGIQNDDKYRNLGGLILGYKIDQSIKQEERSLFRIISERISSTIAAQWMHEHNEATVLEKKRKEFKALFDKYGKVLDHGNKDRSHSNADVDNDVLTQWKQQAEDNLDFAKPFIAIEDKYSAYLKVGEKTHQGLLLNVYLDKQGSNESFLRSRNLFYKSIVNKGFNGFKYDYIDIIFLNDFLKLLHENKGGNTNGNNIAIECKHEGNKQIGLKNKRFEISVEFVGADSQFRMNDFYLKLKSAHNSTGTNFTTFLLNNYELLRIHGDLEITDKAGTSHFLLSRDARLNTKDTKNPFLEITKENIPIDSYEHLCFIIHIQHDLK